MFKVLIITLFFIYGVTVVSACKVDCRTVRCKNIACGPGYESVKPPCACCYECRKIKNPPCETNCKPDDCPLIKCAPGYESVRPPCKCCNECKKMENPPCKPDCSAVLCKYVECAPGYESVTPPCECCNQCRKIENPPCETNCKPDSCPLIKCAPGYISVKPPCKCCYECKKDEKPDGCETDCSGTDNCPQIRCIEGYELVKPKCSCCEVCQKKEECQTGCSEKEECPKFKCLSGYKLAKPKCGCCKVCTKIEDTCGKDEVYMGCGSTCPPSCSNLGKNEVCSFLCVEGCFCRKGLVRNDHGKCVEPNKCPKNTCGKDEVYTECGSACPQTCANLGKNQVCTLQCVQGCFCRKGLVRNDHGNCVEPSKCPKSSCKNTEVDSSSDSDSDEGY